MKRQTKVDITAETVKATIDQQKPTTMTQLAHGLGFKGKASGALAKRIRALYPEIDALLAKMAESVKAKTGDHGKSTPIKDTKRGKAKAATTKPEGKYPRDTRNPFRPTSAYGACFDILAAHKDGLTKHELVRLLAEDTGKDEKHAGYDVQVLLSAKPNENGLNNNDSPRQRACRPGFYIKREGDNVRLAVD